MDHLIKDALTFLKQEARLHSSLLATPEEYDYFSPQKKGAPPEKKGEMIDPEMRQLITKVLPHVTLTSDTPSDREAQHRSHLWKQEFLQATVLVLCIHPSELHYSLTEAIHKRLAPAHLLEMSPMETEGKWQLALASPQLKLILAPPFQEWKSLSVSRFYKETPSAQATSLGNIPLLLMQPPATYQNNPALKKELWKTLSTLLSLST